MNTLPWTTLQWFNYLLWSSDIEAYHAERYARVPNYRLAWDALMALAED